MNVGLLIFLFSFMFVWSVILTVSTVIIWINIKAWSYSTHQIVGPKALFNFGGEDAPQFQVATEDIKEKLSETPEDYRPVI